MEAWFLVVQNSHKSQVLWKTSARRSRPTGHPRARHKTLRDRRREGYLSSGPPSFSALASAADADAAPTDRVVGLSPVQIQRRFTAAARAAGIEARVTAHSGRVGLASELTARGASTTEVMLAGNWKTARMVAHYSAGATAERGAVQKYL